MLLGSVSLCAQQPSGIPNNTDTTTAQAELQQLLNEYVDLSASAAVDVASSSRTSQVSAKQAPATIITITEDQIRLRGYQSLLDVLMDAPDFKMETYSDPEFLNVAVVRGVYGQDKFVILLDGIRISSPTNEIMPILENYPVHMAQQIEILYGPASALYGADAVTGVINIVSKRAEDMTSTIETRLLGAMYNKFTGSLLAGGNFGGGLKWSISGQYSRDAQPDLRMFYPNDYITPNNVDPLQTGIFQTAFGTQRPRTPVSPVFSTTIHSYAALASLYTNEFRLSVFHNFAQTPTSTPYTPSNAVYNDNAYLRNELTVISGTYTKEFNRGLAITALTLSRFDLNPSSNFRNLFSGLEPGYKYSFGAMMKVEQLVSWNFTETLTLTGGATYESFFSVPKGTDLTYPVNLTGAISGIILGSANPQNPSGIRADFYTLNFSNTGGFAQAQWQAAPNLAMTVGARFDYNSRFGSTFNPRLGFVWSPISASVVGKENRLTIKALYGSSFLAPAPRVAFEHYGSFRYDTVSRSYVSDFWKLPNPDLQPIRSQTGELNITAFLTDDINVILSGYYSVYTGLFTEVLDGSARESLYNGKYLGFPVRTILITINQGEQRSYGATANIRYLALRRGDSRLELFGSFTWMEGIVNQNDDINALFAEIPYISPLSFKGGLQGSFGKLHISLRAIIMGTQRAVALQRGNPQLRQTLPGYALLNGSLRYELLPWLDIIAAASNILDARYYTVYAGIEPEAAGIRAASNTGVFVRGIPQHPFRASFGIELRL
ncbi:MAG: TonB-dependent receptor [Bacteroidota bacterium]|nr:TonB-dependent receptor [Candidatus Kapabacteria bacterium]MDW8220515.1 TonB-dependent receptor [Bacteroidota bacterium]